MSIDKTKHSAETHKITSNNLSVNLVTIYDKRHHLLTILKTITHNKNHHLLNTKIYVMRFHVHTRETHVEI